MTIDKDTGLPEWAVNRTALIDKIRATAEGAELALRAQFPIKSIEMLFTQPNNAAILLKWEIVSISLEKLDWFDLEKFTQLAIGAWHDTIKKQSALLAGIIQPWAIQNGIKYTSSDTHTLSSLHMDFSLMNNFAES